MAMPALPFVTAFYAALTGLLCVVLSVLVVRQRMTTRISIGDGGNPGLSRMARVFGNFAEYAALVLTYAQKMLNWRLKHADKTLTGYAASPAGLTQRD